MRPILAGIIVVAAVLPANAESCKERFQRLLTDRPDQGAVKIHATQTIKGGMTTKNFNYQAGDGHWMSEMIEPANMPWSLVYNDTLYTSSDKGKTWVKVRALDSAKQRESSREALAAAAQTVTNAACGSETVDGVTYDTVAADYEMKAYKMQNHDKFWITPETGRIARSETRMKMQSFESVTMQIIEKAPGLELPKPN